MLTDAEQADLDRRFNYHKPEEKADRHAEARGIIKHAAMELAHIVPAGREYALMLTNLEQAMFWANAGIARE